MVFKIMSLFSFVCLNKAEIFGTDCSTSVMTIQLFRNSKESQAFQSVLQLIKELLNALPNMFTNTRETHSALGPALQAAFKLMSPTGGRISVFQTQLPSLGAGLLHSREDPNQRSSTKVQFTAF